MAVKKGVVLEIEGPEAIVLTDRGEFERIPLGRRKLDVGMEITLPSRRKSYLPFVKAWTNWVAGAAAVLMLMAIVPLLSQVRQPGEVVAYVDIDINPSIQLAVNEDEHVVAAEPLNNDGRRVLSEVRVVGRDMEEAVAQITEQAVEDGFINKDRNNAVMVALTPAPGRRVALAWEKRLRDSINSTLQEQHQVAVVDTRVGSTELRLAARRQGLSVGKFMMFLAAKEENLDITVAEMKQGPIGEVIRVKGGNPEELVKEHKPKDWDRIAAKFEPELGEGNPASSSSVALQKPGVDKNTPGKQSEPVAVAAKDGQDKADSKPGINAADDLPKDPPGRVTIAEMHRGSKKPKKPQDDGKAAEPGQGNPAAGQGGDKKPDDPANGGKPGEPANGAKADEHGNGTKPTDGQSPGTGNAETQDGVKSPADQAKVQNSGDNVTVQAGAASAQVPADAAAPDIRNIQAPTNP